MDSNSITPCPQHDLESSDAGRYVPRQERRARPARRRNSNAPPPSPSSRSDNAPGSRPPRPNPLLQAKHFPARFGGGVATALLAALMFLLPSAPSHAQTVAWNATLTSADNWALGNTYTYDGYGSSAFDFLDTTHGSLSPDSFTVSGTTHTVEVLGVREGTDNRLYLITDTQASKSDLAEYSLEITVDGSATTLQVSDATDQANLGFYWAENLHPYGPDDWQTNTITVRLLAPGQTVTISADNPTADHDRKTGRTAFFADFTVTANSAPDETLTVWLGWEEAERGLVDLPSNWSSIDRYVRTQIRAGETSASVAHMLLDSYDDDGKPLQTLTFFIAEDRDASDPHNSARADPEYAVGTPSKACVTVNVDTPDSSKPDCTAMLGARGSRQPRAETLGAPEKVSATASGSSRIDLSWTAPSGGPRGYQVEWSPAADGDWQPVDPAHSGKATEYSHTGLTAETAYYYRVRAFNGDGPGEWSAVDGATTESGPQEPVPLTAELDGVPEAHDGESTFTFGLTFSEEPRVGYRRLRDEAFDVGGGTVRKARRRQSGSDLSWEITVEPSSHRDVSVRLPETGSCSASGAICTGDGRPLSHALSASVRGPAAMSVSDARVEEAAGAAVAFAVTLSRAASDRVTVDYQTRDGSAQAGEDYTAASGTLTFSAGESSKTIEVAVLDDAHDEGEETFTLALSNASGAWLEDAEATGTIENTDLMPAALLARFGRATAEQVVEHVEQRMAAPRERGFRARFAGRELRPGMERDFALGFLSQFGQPTGMGPGGAVPMGAASMGATSRGANPMAANLSGRGTGTTGMTGRQPPMGVGAAMPGGPSGGAHGGGFGSFLPGGDLFSNSEFELNREQHGGVVSVWSRSSRSYFGGMEGALSLDGDVRTTMLGADYRRGPLTVGLSVGRTLGLGGYGGRSAGQVTSSMTGFYPWLGYQVNDRVSVWGVTGYGTGALSLTPDGAAALDTAMSMAMTAAGTRGELIGSRATGGFALAFKADALWVGAATELVDGAAGRLNASQAGVTRVRTALEGSRGFSVGGRVSLTPSVEVGLRQDGGDADTGTGMDVGGGLVFADSVTGLSLDVRMRTLVVHQADGFTERGMSLSFGWDPTPSSPLGLTARVAPSWGGSAMGGADALWRSQMAYGMGSHQMAGSGGQVNAEVGYGLPVGRFVGTPSVGVGTSQYGRDYRLGYRLGLLERGGLDFGLDVSGTRRESTMTPVPDHQVVTSATVTW